MTTFLTDSNYSEGKPEKEILSGARFAIDVWADIRQLTEILKPKVVIAEAIRHYGWGSEEPTLKYALLCLGSENPEKAKYCVKEVQRHLDAVKIHSEWLQEESESYSKPTNYEIRGRGWTQMSQVQMALIIFESLAEPEIAKEKAFEFCQMAGSVSSTQAGQMFRALRKIYEANFQTS